MAGAAKDVADGAHTIPAGSLRVRSPAGLKWVAPNRFANTLRKPASVASSPFGSALETLHNKDEAAAVEVKKEHVEACEDAAQKAAEGKEVGKEVARLRSELGAIRAHIAS